MREEGYHLAALYGIAAFYPRFGFASALIHAETRIATRDAEAAAVRYAVREFVPSDAREVAAIYGAMHSNRTASIVRDPLTWKGFTKGTRWQDRVSAFVVLDRGRIVGYAAYDLDLTRCALAEVGYLEPAVFSTLLGEAARRAVEMRTERILIHLPPDDPFATYCRRYGSESEIHYPRWANGMARVVCQAELLGLVYPLFQRRLEAAGMGGWSSVLALETDLGEDCLSFGAGGETYRVRLPQWMLAQLLLGYRSVDDALFETEAHADPAAIPVLRALLPPGYPYIWASDRF
jgi:hypothetical protein